MALDPAIRAVMTAINKKHGEGTVMLGSEIATSSVETITTGSLSIDAAIGGGWATNHWNEIIGNECLCPGTLVLCTDLIWQPIEDLKIGEEIIGFDEQSWGLGRGRTSCYRRAVVTDLGRKRLPVYKIITEHGETWASEGHLWLAHKNTPRSITDRKRSEQRNWVRTDSLKVGDHIASLGKPWDIDDSWEAGWLAGFYDGEGCIAKQNSAGTNSRVTCAQVLGPTADFAAQMFETCGFEPLFNYQKPSDKNPHYQEKIIWKFPGRYEDMRFLGTVRPKRLLAKADRLWEGRSTKAVHGSTVEVLNIEFMGLQEVATIGTSTKTLIANGMLSHNSAGKTATVLKTIEANQIADPKWMTVWFASEDFSVPYAEMNGIDLERVVIIEENLMEAVFEAAISFVETREVDCIVIDSLPALVSMREDRTTMEDFQPGEAAILTGKFFRKSNKSMKRPLMGTERSITGIVVNQWREKIGYGNPRTTPGGKAKNFYYYQRIEVRRDEWIDNSKGRHIGQTIKAVNEKNKIAPPGRVGTVDYYFDNGNGFKKGEYDTSKDVVSAAKAYDVIEPGTKRGQWVFGEHTWPNNPRLYEAIEEDTHLLAAIKKAVLKATRLPDPVPVKSVAKKAPATKKASRGPS